MKSKTLNIENARENNLKGVSLEIPHDQFVVLTGLSGSGKSSLAFETVYAEGQRRYIETFSPYTRQFFDKVKKPDVDLIEHVRPAIAIQQRTRVTNSRSTVGTMTNVNDYLKVLWGNLASPVCPKCEVALKDFSPKALADHLFKILPHRGHSAILLCAPVTMPTTKQARADECQRLLTLGYSRFLEPSTGSIARLEESVELSSDGKLIVVLDRFRFEALDQKRLQESIEQAFSLSTTQVAGRRSGSCLIVELDEGKVTLRRPLVQVINSPENINQRPLPFAALEFHEHAYCPCQAVSLPRPRPALFSFNHPLGACPECKGFGKILEIDEALCVPNRSLSIEQNALACWAGNAARRERKRLIEFCSKRAIPTKRPWHTLSAEQRALIFEHKSREYRGVRPWFKHLERKLYKMHVRVFLAKYRTQKDCPVCNGARLKPGALAYRIDGRTLPDIWQMTIGELLGWLKGIESQARSRGQLGRDLQEVFTSAISRLEFLVHLGLSYLTLERQARTLSGGETQRVNLATALGSGLVSTQFVLDEPSVGLHARDTNRLIGAIRKLKDQGNSLLVVEHDFDCINQADHIVELGPGAGTQGGEVTYNNSRVGWRGPLVEAPVPAKVSKTPHKLSIKNAVARNLKGFDLDIPLNRFVVLTGVSGSGKSTLVSEVIEHSYKLWSTKDPDFGTQNTVTGFEHIEQLLLVDQSPLAKSPRANIATYTGIWEQVRRILADSDEARDRALSKSAFSFNVDGGRCPACKGAGFVTEDMQFLSDVYIPCEVCLGKRFQPSVLDVKCRGFDVHQLLQLSVDECCKVFADLPEISSIADTLGSLGLGHLSLGHPLSALSGGEAQRLKLVPFVEKSAAGKSLLIFDEPTTGLHTHDVQRLVQLLKLLTERGHSVLCVEHNLQLISASDWLIDLGPEAGDKGGEILFSGTPEQFISGKAPASSLTATFLREYQSKVKSRSLFEVAAPTKKSAAANKIPDVLAITGAREHNLKNVDLVVPLNKFVAFTGVSGSGKSSLAKDIIYAEGQRRYLDCLSPFARQYIKELARPEIDAIDNVQPTICVYQHTFQPGRLSTVGTMSEVYNFLRLLFAKVGIQYCPDHPRIPITPLSVGEIAQQIKKSAYSSVKILAPIVKLKKGTHRAIIERALQSDVIEVRIDGVFLKPGTLREAGGGLEKSKAHSIDYVIAKFSPAQLDIQLIQESVSQALALGGGTVIMVAGKDEQIFSLSRTCSECKKGFFKPDPEDLSFHSKRGACTFCGGAGTDDGGQACPECEGSRLNPIGRNIRLDGLNIHELSAMPPPKLGEFLKALTLDNRSEKISAPIMQELSAKLKILSEIGLDYIELSRDCLTLSNGELQRLRLATAMGSPLAGVMYIFDEPSIGLHPNDTHKVLGRLKELRDRGNSVLMIEHDPECILATDYVIEVGPGGGSQGGGIVFNGPAAEFRSCGSLTAQALLGNSHLGSETPVLSRESLRISAKNIHNIKSIDTAVPLNCLVAVAGVSGAGKSSLMHGIISDTLTLGESKNNVWCHGSSVVRSTIPIERVLLVDQKPIGLNSRSTPASYLGIWDDIRALFASAIESKARGWTQSYFSYNTGKGRCPDCKGQGVIRLEMNFLADASVICETCGGNRYGEDATSVRYLNFTIADVLRFTFEEAKTHFANHRKIHRTLQQACELGIGYLTLGQSSATLSGGESQRIKLVSELSTPRTGHTIYILDEPTTGLHKIDVARLTKVLKDLVAKGHSVILIEHDLDVLLRADHIIEMGPGPGAAGGKVIFSGSINDLTNSSTPWGIYLREHISISARRGHDRGPEFRGIER